MKKSILKYVLIFTVCFSLNSCYTYSFTVGDGAQKGVETSKMNLYLIGGLAPVSISDPAKLANGATDYDVTIKHTFVDGLINVLSGSLVSPTTTIVTK